MLVYRYFTQRSLLFAIDELVDRYKGGNTNTAGGIEKMRMEVFTKTGDRSNAPNVAIIITDGIRIHTFPS